MPRREKVGTVVSNKMDKTIVVAVREKKPNPTYGKIQTWTTKFKAHDEANACNEGDVVRIVESRPISRDKTWKLVEVVEKVQQV